MPYKDKEARRAYQREYMREARSLEKMGYDAHNLRTGGPIEEEAAPASNAPASGNVTSILFSPTGLLIFMILLFIAILLITHARQPI